MANIGDRTIGDITRYTDDPKAEIVKYMAYVNCLYLKKKDMSERQFKQYADKLKISEAFNLMSSPQGALFWIAVSWGVIGSAHMYESFKEKAEFTDLQYKKLVNQFDKLLL